MSLLICHHDAPLDHEGLAAWLASFSEVAGVVLVEENSDRKKKRIKRELKRLGNLRFVDVLAFRLYSRFLLARRDSQWEAELLNDLRERWPVERPAPVLRTHSPNSEQAREFIERAEPDIMIARCKSLLEKSIFSISTVGTFVMHPGICPEYRNAHGGFWALAQDDLNRVGTTLLKIDEGVDTGPVYGYYSCDYDEVDESHIVIQQRSLFENLDEIAQKLVDISEDKSETIDTAGRRSSTYGQPWLSQYLRWKLKARMRRRGQ